MTLRAETTALLAHTVCVLDSIMSPGTHSLLSADERKFALRQLMLTVETAAKLAEAETVAEVAEVVHVETLAQHKGKGSSTNTACAMAETKRAGVTELERLDSEAERVAQEMELLKAELETTRSEKLNTEAEIQQLKVENQRLNAELDMVEKEAEGAVEETMEVNAGLWRLRSACEGATEKMGNLTSEAEMVRKEMLEADTPRSEKDAGGAVDETGAVNAESARLGNCGESAAKEMAELRSELEITRTIVLNAFINKQRKRAEPVKAGFQRLLANAQRVAQEIAELSAELEKARIEKLNAEGETLKVKVLNQYLNAVVGIKERLVEREARGVGSVSLE